MNIQKIIPKIVLGIYDFIILPKVKYLVVGSVGRKFEILHRLPILCTK